MSSSEIMRMVDSKQIPEEKATSVIRLAVYLYNLGKEKHDPENILQKHIALVVKNREIPKKICEYPTVRGRSDGTKYVSVDKHGEFSVGDKVKVSKKPNKTY